MRILLGDAKGGDGASFFGVQASNGDVFGSAVRIGLLLLPTAWIIIGENGIAKILGAMRIVDLDTVDLDGFGHPTGIAEIVKTVIVGGENAHFDGTVLGGGFFGGTDGRFPDAVAQDQFAVEEGSVIRTKIDHAVAEEGGVFDERFPKADKVDAHVTEGATFNGAVGYAHVGVKAGHDAILQIKVLGKVGSHQTPIFGIGDICRLSDIQQSDVDDSVHVDVIRAHGNRNTWDLGCGIIGLMSGHETIRHCNITAFNDGQKAAVRSAVVFLACNKMSDSPQGRVGAGYMDISSVIIIKGGRDVGDGHKNAAFNCDGGLLGGKSISLGYRGIIPVDIACHIPFSVHDKTIRGGDTVVLVGPPSDVSFCRFVKNSHVQIFFMGEIDILLSALESRDLGLKARRVRCYAEAGGIDVFKLTVIDGEFGRSPADIGFDDGCEVTSANVIIGAVGS